MSSTLLAKSRPAGSPETDPSTLSNYRQVSVKHTNIAFKVDWAQQRLVGRVQFKLGLEPSLNELVLDSSYIDIKSVLFNGQKHQFHLAPRAEPLGAKLSIDLNGAAQENDNSLEIDFSTTAECTAVQWMTPEQTDDKVAPYLFSQCQAIHARSLFPCFDTPAVKSTFSIAIQSKYATVSSGNIAPEGSTKKLFGSFFDDGSSDDKVYEFVQEQVIPSYLFSIASGAITSASIGPRSKVYTEKGNLAACKYEFEADTERFIQTAEKIVFPYDWKTYNVLVLPQGFPYGGMENPNMTFATPTLISGDRENVDVIAHELAHSWSGNLVTNCSWEHFWLNEGWTVYLERRIVGAIHGEPHRHFSAIIGWGDLEEAIKTLGESGKPYTKLVVDLKGGQDPDDAFSTVPYEKGFNFLFMLENLVGREAFDPFIPYYFGKFKGKSLDSYQFRDTLYEFFADKKDLLDSIDWDTWYYTAGLPAKPKFDTSVADACYALADKWIAAADKGNFDQFAKSDLEGWTSTQAVVFLSTLSAGLKNVADEPRLAAAKAIDATYQLSKSKNFEVIARWYALAIGAKVQSEYQSLANWLGTVGRMKFVRPGYRQLNSVDRQLALDTFNKYKEIYHPICRTMVAKDLGL